MKKLFLLSFLFLASCAELQNSNAHHQQYVYGTEDIPVYEGFGAVDTKNVAYDSEAGRIVDATYFGNQAKPDDIKIFYTEVLAQLGWKKKKAGEYTREGESLKLNISEKGSLTFIKFSIRPAS